MMDCTLKSQYISSKNAAASKDSAEMFDIKPLLELLHVNNDVNVQLKLFSTLSAYIMTHEESRDVIITYNSLYDKIYSILSNCPPRRTTVTLNFLSALLYAVDDDIRRKSLTVYAKNMIRTSGCLATMCELFTSCMMHQDVWRSLCRCLTETCREVEANQSYCTHLVPMCVQRCSQRNIEVFSVLQSLLQNHARNIQLFIECDGISLFQREYLQHDDCLQLLNTLVQSSSQAVRLINESDVGQHMRDFLHMYGPQTQLGLWATIILYYLKDAKETAVLPRESQAAENKTLENTINKSIAENDNMQCSTDTTKLLENVMKELIQCGTPGDLKYLKALFPTQPMNTQTHKTLVQQASVQNHPQSSNICTSKQNCTLKYNFSTRHLEGNDFIRNKGTHHTMTKNTSFSFLQYLNRRQNTTQDNNSANRNNEYLHRTVHTEALNSTGIDKSVRTITNIQQNIPDINSFNPKYASTPKKNNFKWKMDLSRTSLRRQRSFRKHELKRRIEKRRMPKRRLQHSQIDKENNHRSISGWFFDTINESCTTLVKTVKNIFKPKISSEETQPKSLSPISVNNTSSCSFSFTNYMRKRDAVLKNERTEKCRVGVDDFSSESANSCHTCNDTVSLKHKLGNDEYLKQTVRKLKLGINLYGCDFKKISKQLWPEQTYMTPVVLYNLYRKLILK